MKFGFNMLLWSSRVSQEHFRYLELIQQVGYDGVEIPLFEGDAKLYRGVGRELDRIGLARTAITIVDPTSNPVSPDAAIRKAATQRLHWAIDMSAIVGAELLCGPIHSALGTFTGAGPTNDERKWAADVLREAADYAAKSKITLAVEYLNRFESYFLTTAADTKALIEAVNHPNFKAMYDTFHANIEEKQPLAALASLKGVLVHMHVSENDRGTLGAGHIPWAETFATLKKMNYDGWLMIEAFGRVLPDLAAATRVWRDFFPTADDVPADSYRFLRKAWEQA